MTWRVESTIIDEWVPAPREAWRVVNEFGDVVEGSLSEDYADACAMADALNNASTPSIWTTRELGIAVLIGLVLALVLALSAWSLVEIL